MADFLLDCNHLSAAIRKVSPGISLVEFPCMAPFVWHCVVGVPLAVVKS
jgi:hypothetical protein